MILPHEFCINWFTTGLFYFVLGNLLPMFRSKLRRINLLAIAKCEHIKKYGIDVVLKPILEDIKKLCLIVLNYNQATNFFLFQEAGYTFDVHGMPYLKYGTISIVSADNLASNLLGGFKEGSTAYRGCRQCFATPSQMKSTFKEDQFDLRTPTDHSSKCDDLDAATTQAEYDELSREFGINRRSTLNELMYFDVCSGALVQDVMHDVLEGMCSCSPTYNHPLPCI